MGVWGYQSAIWSEKIQGMHRSRIFMLGTTFAEAMKQIHEKNPADHIRERLGLPKNKRILLFAGAARGGNEVSKLIMLEEAIENGILRDCCVFYRPHPFRLAVVTEPNFFQQNFKHVIIDPTLEERFRQFWTDDGIKPFPRKASKFPRDFRHTVDLFSISSVMIAPITTYMLEALWFGIPCVEIGYVDSENSRFNIRYDIPSSAALQCLPSSFACMHPDQLLDTVNDALQFGELQRNMEVSRRYLGNLVCDDDMPFGERIVNAADAILNHRKDGIHHFLNNPIIDVDKQENVVVEQ